jgi:nucleotide-binding universal stress UspA family protein
MNDANWVNGPPKSILLATDLSARCDRALDRAVFLSQLWQAKLVILHVLENVWDPDSDSTTPSWRRPPDPTDVATKQLLADIGPLQNAADVVIGEGDPTEVIARTAETKGCDLIVTGVARDELFGRFILGTTVDRLLRRSQEPILIVKKRARHGYRRIAVAIDFSESSRHALEATMRFFPDQALTIFHAYEAPVSGLTTDSAAYRRQYRQVVEQDYEAFLASVKSGETIRQRARSFIEYGAPDEVLRRGVREMDIDLIVVGTEGRGALSEILVGSVGKHLMAELPCDVLMIREPPAATEAAA